MRLTIARLLFAVSIFMLVIGGAHYYFLRRLVFDTALPSPWSELAMAAVATLGASMIAHPVVDRVFGPRAAAPIGWPSYIWMAACFYLLLGLWASDAVMALLGLGGVEVARARAVGLTGIIGLALLVGFVSALRPPAVRRIEVRIPNWPEALDGFRIVQMSDIHIGSLIRRRFAERIVARCNALDPDLLAITGDLVDGSVHHLQEDVAPFGNLRARHGVFFVTGNHDHYSGASGWVRRVTELGMRPLRNERVTIGNGEGAFELAGVDDISSRRVDGRGYDMRAAMAAWDGARPVVLLSHDPRSFEHARKHGVHLQLSGHTHGGQMWPFSWFVRMQTRYVAGRYQVGDSQLYVSRGTGYWGPPIRLLAPAEITELTLRPGTPN